MIAKSRSPGRAWPACGRGSIALFPDSSVVGISTIYQQDQEIFGEGEPADQVYTVLRGVVRTCKLLDDGRRQIAAFYFPGDSLGLEQRESYSATAEAVVAVQAAVFKRHQIIAAASTSVDVARGLWTRTAQNLHHAESHMLLLGRKTALERVESFLIEMEQRGRRAGRLNLPMSRRDIADYLGLTIETVSRVISQMQNDGRIQRFGPRRIALQPEVPANGVPIASDLSGVQTAFTDRRH